MARYETILEQLGGRKFVAMTGAKSFYGFEDTLRFRLPSRFAKDGINFVTVMLKPDDTYYVEYGKLYGRKYEPKYKQVAVQTGVYVDGLKEAFTLTTGLDCSL